MMSGVYFVEFRANNNNVGQGLIAIDDGRINGGDNAFLFQGRLDTYNDQLRAVIEVTHYRGEANSIFGSVRQFTLNLSGSSDANTFKMSGGVANMQGASISIVGRKVAELYK